MLALALAAAAALSPLPDLYIGAMPTKPYNDHVAPVVVDTFEQPGHVLYRFDTVLANKGGTLDIYRDSANGHVIQAIWPRGVPTARPDTETKPEGDGVKLVDLSATRGAEMPYVTETSHQ